MRIPTTSDLFDDGDDPYVHPYGSMPAELRAVKAGTKAMAMYLSPRSGIDDPEGLDEDVAEIFALAVELGLSIMVVPSSDVAPVREVRIYVTHPEQSWRVSAHRAMWKVIPQNGGWSDGAEALEGHLLGYTDNEISAWRESRRRRQQGWGGATLLFLVAQALRVEIEATGNRCIPPRPSSSPPVAIRAPSHDVLKSDAWSVVGESVSIARAMVQPEFVFRLFRAQVAHGENDIVAIDLTQPLIADLNLALRSRIEFFGPHGWV